MITFNTVAEELDNLLTYINTVRSGKPIYWANPATGEGKQATMDDNLSYIEDQILLVAAGVNILKEELKKQVNKFTD
ncbi:hypothetical protein [Actinobacillus equuli]|uniref:hypothetical protein n=1 Tax=Actinobacillus equuli TaxID=718 RepID=UPI00244281E8|nr:hypothetical protein [Actinobacillus equuli]WGE43038.1 hypothetical protein NYR64_04135 [Actinobacillus equuli subsp. haemolyticus]WGE79917.1 hypothetical protein NYR83_02970 [Actinobacillus equuli subsp. equuli]